MEVIQKEELKRDFRTKSIKRLKLLSQRSHYKKDKQVIERLYNIIKESEAKDIMLFIPMKLEVNIYSLLKRLRVEKRRIYVPFMEGKSFRLVKYRYPLEKKRFGIKEPKFSRQFRIKKLDIAIVPVVGVDSTLRRVGFGKGMYDRFFEKELKNIDKVVFVSRALCYSAENITNHYDVNADIIVVP